MFRTIGRMALVVAVVGCGALAAFGDDLDSAEKKIVAAWKKHKTMTAKITMVSHMEMGEMTMDGSGSGTGEDMRQGDKLLARLELNNVMTRKMGEQETKMEQPMTTVIDGEAAYTLTEMMGQKMAIKSDIDPQMSGDPEALFRNLHKDHDLKLMPEQTVNDAKVFVIEVNPKEGSSGQSFRQVYSFDQKSGCMVKMEAYSGAGEKPAMTMTYSDIKLDVQIDPKRFKFELPEGVTLMDQTGAATSGG